jgi:serine/threonine protein kinase
MCIRDRKYSVDEGKDAKSFRRSCDVMCKFDHPGILRLRAVAISASGEMYSEVEYYPNGDLKQWMQNNPNRTHPQNGSILFHVSHALRVLHQNGVIHRDLKPANILVTHDNLPVIADFDSSRLLQVDSTITSNVGTLEYMDPVAMRSGVVTESVDLYSLGVIASELIFGGKRFSSLKEVPNDSRVPQDAQDLLKGLLCHDREKRWTLDQLLSCRYVRGVLRCVICFEHSPGDEMIHCSQLPFSDPVSHAVCLALWASWMYLNSKKQLRQAHPQVQLTLLGHTIPASVHHRDQSTLDLP